MDSVMASVIISSHNRTPLLLRTLFAIAERGPSIPFEVVLADDGSTEDVEGTLRKFSSAFPWTLVKVDKAVFTNATGVVPFFNNPALTNNIAFKHANPKSNLIFTQGNEVIAWKGVYDSLVKTMSDPGNPASVVFSTTYDVPQEMLRHLDPYGSNLDQRMVDHCAKWPLQSVDYRSDVTNYLSLASRDAWERIGGYDERYLSGIGGEDSDFVRRIRSIGSGRPTGLVSEVSLHMDHGGFSVYRDAPVSTITKERRLEGETIKWALYNAWDGTHENQQPWPWGEIGVVDVVKNH